MNFKICIDILVDSLVKYHLIIAVKSRIQILIDFQNVNLPVPECALTFIVLNFHFGKEI